MGDKNYFLEQLAKAKMDKIIYTKALCGFISNPGDNGEMFDEIIERISQANSLIRYYKGEINKLESEN